MKKHPATVYAALMAELSKDTASNILSVLLQYAEEEKGVWNEELAALVAHDLGRFVGLYVQYGGLDRGVGAKLAWGRNERVSYSR